MRINKQRTQDICFSQLSPRNETRIESHIVNIKNLSSLPSLNSLYKADSDKKHITLLKKADDCLLQTRSYFKGSPNKSANKIRLNRTVQQHQNCLEQLSKNRAIKDKKAFLLAAIQSKTGNCGELAAICYVLSCHAGLNPNFVRLIDVKNKRFDHVFCQIAINGQDYNIDPWANIVCKKEDYNDLLKTKIADWNSKGKYLAQDLNWSNIGSYLETKNSEILGENKITMVDIDNMVEVYNGKYNDLDKLAEASFLRRSNSSHPTVPFLKSLKMPRKNLCGIQ
ncbi:hypothetical protein AB6H26_15505 [Providencia hangzhouensis]|uniref:Transglutaminase-like domain-containing protein n=2 Tax=Providencia TaxID=586 RepID=A0A264VP41_PRORE|nr:MULTISPECIES: hypothetical protein [Providencia]MBN6366074.1 hypothetical protein [Providencia rettgeri]MBN7844042.1 hypothetical protein [Providencia rettgeri]MBN7855928.1 hypothetical protein [Providencia rettgeri]MBN7863995.1 hypothetical protein [Providencia rettgeri]MBN7874412.1 hypothetical protein [Providencia rettgeri]